MKKIKIDQADLILWFDMSKLNHQKVGADLSES